mgnify:CR=1 FL=1
MLRKVLTFILILVCFVLQSTVFRNLSFAGIVPNLLIILTASFGFMRGDNTGILIGFICGFVGAGGGMMMLLILTSVLGYELKTAVGTSVFIMAFTALTGAISHFSLGDSPDIWVMVLCVVFTFIWAQIAAKFANKAKPETLNRVVGVVLVVLGIVILGFEYFIK